MQRRQLQDPSSELSLFATTPVSLWRPQSLPDFDTSITAKIHSSKQLGRPAPRRNAMTSRSQSLRRMQSTIPALYNYNCSTFRMVRFQNNSLVASCVRTCTCACAVLHGTCVHVCVDTPCVCNSCTQYVQVCMLWHPVVICSRILYT